MLCCQTSNLLFLLESEFCYRVIRNARHLSYKFCANHFQSGASLLWQFIYVQMPKASFFQGHWKIGKALEILLEYKESPETTDADYIHATLVNALFSFLSHLNKHLSRVNDIV